jgi:hypothetical protein
METLEILFVALPIVALIAAVALFFSFKEDKEYTINLTLHEFDDLIEPPVAPEPVAKPKRRYKRRKKKVVTPVVEAPKAEIIPAVKKRVGRPKKTT